MDDYDRFHFSATCQTSDDAVLNCLRALCQWAEEHSKPQIGWGGSTVAAWKKDQGRVVLRFTDPRYRDQFVRKAEELFAGKWSLVKTSDADPARRQRPPH